MAFDTYANLQLEVLAKLLRLQDTDAVTRVPSWITLAEDSLGTVFNRLMVRQGETVDSAFSISSEYTALPSGFFRMRSNPVLTSVSPVQVLDYVAPTVADLWDPYVNAGQPRLHTIQGNQLRVYPPPSTTYTAKLTYFALPPLSVSNASNWLLVAHPKLYYKATLAEAYDYYDDAAAREAAAAERDSMIAEIYATDGSDQQGTRMKVRVNGGTP